METSELLQQVRSEIQDLKKIVQMNSAFAISQRWLPRSQVKDFFEYGDTQMCALEKSGKIVISKVGRRKFILRESLEKFLNENSQSL